MATITREITIAAPPEAVWARLRDWAALHTMARGFVTATTSEDRERVVTFFTGATARETIVTVDDEQRRLVWTVTESPLDYVHHNGASQVHDAGGATRFVWSADFLPDELEPVLGPLMERGLAAISQTLEESGTDAGAAAV